MVNSAVRNHAALSLVDTFAKPQKDGGLATYEKGVLIDGAKKLKGIVESAPQEQKIEPYKYIEMVKRVL